MSAFTLIRDAAIIEGYLTDASNIKGYAQALVRPKSIEEVAAVVGHCQRQGIVLTVTAGRTSTTGAPVPFGGWLLSMEHLSAIVDIGQDTACAQGGVNLGAFQQAIEATGRFFPPDPTSRFDCTLGAAIACNASGARSFRYGPTRKWIESLVVVLPTGEIRSFSHEDPVPESWPVIYWDEPDVKSAAGYAPPGSALDVFIGQEGTLGIIVQATVRLVSLPKQVLGFMAFFSDRAAALAFVRDARGRGQQEALSPSCLEYFDGACLAMARRHVPEVPLSAGAALFCEQQVLPGVGEEGHLSAWWEALKAHAALVDETIVSTTDTDRTRLHQLRHAIPVEINEIVVRNQMPKVGTDLAVPDEGLQEMLVAYDAAPMEHVLFGHIGDNHLHLNLLPKNQEELAVARAFYATLVDKALALGGTVSAEHGIGKIKKEALHKMVGSATLQSFRELKAFFDPAFILGRGNLFD